MVCGFFPNNSTMPTVCPLVRLNRRAPSITSVSFRILVNSVRFILAEKVLKLRADWSIRAKMSFSASPYKLVQVRAARKANRIRLGMELRLGVCHVAGNLFFRFVEDRLDARDRSVGLEPIV